MDKPKILSEFNATFGKEEQSKEVADVILKNMEKNSKAYVMGSPDRIEGLSCTFSGADIMGWFDGDIPELMACSITKNSMTAIFALSDTVSKVMLNEGWFPFHIIGINEAGHKSLISGTCRPIDFEITTSIDELNIETKVYFESKITEIRGWLNCSKEDNKYISELFLKLRMERFILKGGDPRNVEYIKYLEHIKKNQG